MTIPAWIPDCFAVLMLMVAAIATARVVSARRAGRRWPDSDIDAAHVLMGVAMAGLLMSGLHTLPDAAWAVIFGVLTTWFAWRVAADVRADGAAALGAGHHLPHLVHGAAMVYMSLAVITGTPGSRMVMGARAAGVSSPGTLRTPALGFAFALFMAAWAVWDLDQMSTAHLRDRATAGGPRLVRTRPAMALADAGSAEAAVVAGRGPDPAVTFPGLTVARAPVAAALPAAPISTASRDLARRICDPRVAVGCRIAMGVTMAFMLVVMG